MELHAALCGTLMTSCCHFSFSLRPRDRPETPCSLSLFFFPQAILLCFILESLDASFPALIPFTSQGMSEVVTAGIKINFTCDKTTKVDKTSEYIRYLLSWDRLIAPMVTYGSVSLARRYTVL